MYNVNVSVLWFQTSLWIFMWQVFQSTFAAHASGFTLNSLLDVLRAKGTSENIRLVDILAEMAEPLLREVVDHIPPLKAIRLLQIKKSFFRLSFLPFGLFFLLFWVYSSDYYLNNFLEEAQSKSWKSQLELRIGKWEVRWKICRIVETMDFATFTCLPYVYVFFSFSSLTSIYR